MFCNLRLDNSCITCFLVNLVTVNSPVCHWFLLGTLLPNDTQGTIYTFSKIKKIPMVSWVLIIAELCLTLLCLISSKGQNKTYSHICCTNKKFPILFLVFCHWYDTECPSFSQLFQSLQACPHHISSKDLNTVINMASPKSMRNHMQHQECHLQCWHMPATLLAGIPPCW